METCLGCGGRNGHPHTTEIIHAPECPVLRGAEWRCTCDSYCDDQCDGCFQYPDGSYAEPIRE